MPKWWRRVCRAILARSKNEFRGKGLKGVGSLLDRQNNEPMEFDERLRNLARLDYKQTSDIIEA